MFVDISLPESSTVVDPEISFSSKDLVVVFTREDDPMVISVQLLGYNVRRVLINPRSSDDILYYIYDAFEWLNIDYKNFQPFKGSLVGFVGEQVQVKGYVSIKTIFGEGQSANMVRVRCLVVKTPASYNIIMGRPINPPLDYNN